VTIAIELGVIEKSTDSLGLSRGVYTVGFALVLKKVHITANGRILAVFGFALQSLRIAQDFAGIFAHELAACKRAGRENAAAFRHHTFDFEARFELQSDRAFDLLAFFSLQIGSAFAR
jgi:hypothetical protein